MEQTMSDFFSGISVRTLVAFFIYQILDSKFGISRRIGAMIGL